MHTTITEEKNIPSNKSVKYFDISSNLIVASNNTSKYFEDFDRI